MRRVSRSFHVCTLGRLIASGIAPAIGVRKQQQPQSTRQVGRCVVDEFSSASIENARVRTAELVPAGSFTNFGNQNAPASVVGALHDILTALDAWVERDTPPDRIVASRLANGAVVRTRPLCPYPSKARDKGNGSNGRRGKLRLPVRHESIT